MVSRFISWKSHPNIILSSQYLIHIQFDLRDTLTFHCADITVIIDLEMVMDVIGHTRNWTDSAIKGKKKEVCHGKIKLESA